MMQGNVGVRRNYKAKTFSRREEKECWKQEITLVCLWTVEPESVGKSHREVVLHSVGTAQSEVKNYCPLGLPRG